MARFVDTIEAAVKYEWMEDARCLDVLHPMWDESTPGTEALRFCFRCPVIHECANYGLSAKYSSDWGVLGGLGLFDRQKIRAGKTTVAKVWKMRLAKLVLAEHEQALTENE